MPTMEQIIQPFQGDGVGPREYEQPGQSATPPVLVKVGLAGKPKVFPGSYSYTCATKLGAVHSEAPSNSKTIQGVIANPTGG